MKKLLLFIFIISFHSYAQDTIPAAKSVVALDKMNVVYRGVENPISIAVNNAKSYIISGKGVSKNRMVVTFFVQVLVMKPKYSLK